MKYQKVSNNPLIQDAYDAMRENGQSHKMAEMLAFKSAPGLKTDTRFQARIDRSNSVPPQYRKLAKQAGVTTDGKQYFTQLAKYPGDPEAWQSDRSGIKRVCEKRGWSCDGAVTVKKTHEFPDDPPYQVADRIVQREVDKQIALDPGAGSTKQKRDRLVDDTRTRLNGHGKVC